MAWGSLSAIAAAWIYGLGLVACLSVSFTYNIWPHSRVKWFLRLLDHSAIFILIAATYTPFLMRGIDDPLIAVMLGLIWLAALCGILLKCLFPGRYDRVAIGLYLAMGWSGIMVVEPLSTHLSPVTLWLIVAAWRHLFARRHLPCLGKVEVPECHLARFRGFRRRGSLFRRGHLVQPRSAGILKPTFSTGERGAGHCATSSLKGRGDRVRQ